MLAPIQMERSFKMPKYYGSNQIHAHILQSTQQQQTPPPTQMRDGKKRYLDDI